MNIESLNDQSIGTQRLKLRKIAIGCFAIYLLLVVSLYFLAGEAFQVRDSRGNLPLPIAKTGTVELITGATVEQVFTPEIQIFDGVNVQWGTYGRQNAGTVRVALYDTTNGAELAAQTLSAVEITEGMVLPLRVEPGNENLAFHPLLIRITSDDALPGSATSPMMDPEATLEGGQLYFNGQPVDGVLCFSTMGRDYVWTGLHYKEIVIAGAVILLLAMAIIYFKYKHGKKSAILYAIDAMNKYRFLIHQLVSRDFKTKYKRSVLGVLWSFLNPLLMMAVQYFVFSNIFKSDIENYHIYLLIGIVLFNFFSEACGMTLMSVLGNASLITKVYIPKYIYPLSRVLSSTVNLLISLIPLFLAILITGIPLGKSFVLIVFPIFCLIVFALGLGMLLSAAMVFFRDTQFIWNVLSMIWMYATPIFYPESILPEEFRFVLQINPLNYFITFVRTCILDGASPEPAMYVQCLLFAVGMLLIGSFVFKKTQDKFILSL